MRGAGIEVTEKLHEETWNAASNLCWQSVQDPCRMLFENCRCLWNRSLWLSDLKICLFSEHFPIFIAYHQRRNEGGKGAQFRGRRIIARELKSHNNVISTVFKTMHLLPKHLSFEHGGAKLVFFPRRHLTSLRPCTSRFSSQNGEICLQKYLPISGKLSIANLYKTKCCWLSRSFDHRK